MMHFPTSELAKLVLKLTCVHFKSNGNLFLITLLEMFLIMTSSWKKDVAALARM